MLFLIVGTFTKKVTTHFDQKTCFTNITYAGQNKHLHPGC